jgi:hypothetical protein
MYLPSIEYRNVMKNILTISLFSAILLAFMFSIIIYQTKSSFAEPDTEEFMKTYKTKIAQAMDGSLSPKKQIEIGIHMRDIICTNDKILIMKLSASDSVSCVRVKTAQTLVERDWGILLTEKLPLGSGDSSGCWISWTIQHDIQSDNEQEIFRLNSQLIRTMRTILPQFQQEGISTEMLLWSPIRIFNQLHQTQISFGWPVTEQQNEQIIANFNNVKNVVSVNRDTSGICT